MKYRVIKKELCGRIWYEIQYKFLFWWFYETISDIGWHGEISGCYNISFDTEKEARNYICKQQNPNVFSIIHHVATSAN